MDWATCPRCGFTQIPSDQCLRCQRILQRTERATPAKPAGEAREMPSRAPASPPARRVDSRLLWVAAVILGLLIAGGVLWTARAGRARTAAPERVVPDPSPPVLDLAGHWRAQTAILLAAPKARPAAMQASIETDRDGQILGAEVLLTDPGHGGAGAGYRMRSGARDLLDRFASQLAEQPAGAPLVLEFIPLPPWIPQRPRLWRALEGQRRGGAEVRYLLLESVEDDYLVQAGINQTGFLSWAFFSPEYASGRGQDALSSRIHPAPGSSLRGFQNLVWDFSGAADFLKLEVAATVSGPAGVPTRLVLRRDR